VSGGVPTSASFKVEFPWSNFLDNDVLVGTGTGTGTGQGPRPVSS
jgi:hypothetical protein